MIKNERVCSGNGPKFNCEQKMVLPCINSPTIIMFSLHYNVCKAFWMDTGCLWVNKVILYWKRR